MVDYHQLYVAPAEVWPEFDTTSDAEMVQVMPDHRTPSPSPDVLARGMDKPIWP